MAILDLAGAAELQAVSKGPLRRKTGIWVKFLGAITKISEKDFKLILTIETGKKVSLFCGKKLPLI